MNTSIAVPAPPFDLVLSHWDRTFPPTHSKRILCFSLPKDANKEQIVDHLHIALHHTVQRVPFLAGSVVPFSSEEDDRPWLRNISPEGAAYLDVKDLSEKLSFQGLADSQFDQQLFDADELCSLPQVAYVQREPVDVCRIQANFIDGGLLLVVQIVHTVIDGSGVTECIKLFSESFRRAQAGELGHPLLKTESKYTEDRTTLVSGNGLPGAIENHPALTTSAFAHGKIFGIENACHTYRISHEALIALKQAASPQHPKDNNDWVSTGDAIAALIWRSIMLARHHAGHLPAESASYCGQPYDCRKLLGLPGSYFGNAMYIFRSALQFAELSKPEEGLRAAARAIRADVTAMTVDKIRDMVAFMERTSKESHTRLSFMEDLASSAIIYTSHFGFNIHELDFGPAFGDGRIKAFRHPARGTTVGAVIVMPKLIDGSCEFMITEQPDTLRYLAEDPVFQRFTNDKEVPVTSDIVPATTGVPPTTKITNSKTIDTQASNGICLNVAKPNSSLLCRNIEASHGGTIAVIELNRPEAKNAISKQMLEDLNVQIDRIYSGAKENQVRALIISSAVDDVFCAGADLKERRRMTLDETRAFLTSLRHTFSRLALLPIPSIACVSGLALGGGLELALCCHFRIFSGNAVVGLPETQLAIIPGAGGTYRLQKLVGMQHALDMILTGRRVEAVEAARMGLCSRLVVIDADAESVRKATTTSGLSLAQGIAKGGPIAVRAALSALAGGSEEAENAAYDVVLPTQDRITALQHFGKGISPVFAGI
ncbi:putative enoyl-CoA hydratase/isomerase family protein [Lophiotrema nucula]|uniref:Putative enoyl-CoA hydratase/isomerase family protein n=1 Tax=Lophiotrema nucula TaxID=690887 RepID=A0A6A5ZPL4_9PLEO|nr:putative enoyl-CoA hydratase/isomerase family protein [Lophiotrema nucula]